MKTVILNYLKNRMEEKTTWVALLSMLSWFCGEYFGVVLPFDAWIVENNIPLNEIIIGVCGALFGIPSNVMVAIGHVIKK